MINLTQLSHRYPNGHLALHNINLEIKDGEILALIGRSGCGKSSLLKTINGLVKPLEGQVSLRGAELDYEDLPAIRRRIGYVIQHVGLFPHLTVAQNIDLVATLELWSKTHCIDRRNPLLEMVGLDPSRVCSKYPSQLSGGEQQRIGLVRALMLDPQVLLMDEPFGALDPMIRKQLQEEFLQLDAVHGKTVVFVTHDLREAMRLGDRIAIMDAGQILQVGTPHDILNQPNCDYVEQFVATGLDYDTEWSQGTRSATSGAL